MIMDCVPDSRPPGPAARLRELRRFRTFMRATACCASGPSRVEPLLIGPMPHIPGVPASRDAGAAVVAAAVAGLYLTRARGAPPARTYPKADLVDDSSGAVMSM